MYEGSFLVGLEKLEDERWKEAGLWEWLQEYTTLEILLEVPVLGNGFVREHYHLSPKGFIEKQGVDIIRMLKRCEISDRDPRYLSGLQAYVASAVPLAEYDGSFRVPEFWLQQETPVEKVRVIYG